MNGELKIPPNKFVTENQIELLKYLKQPGKIYPWTGIILAIDGVTFVGKTTLAAFLSWQLGMPYIPLDEFMEGSDKAQCIESHT